MFSFSSKVKSSSLLPLAVLLASCGGGGGGSSVTETTSGMGESSGGMGSNIRKAPPPLPPPASGSGSGGDFLSVDSVFVTSMYPKRSNLEGPIGCINDQCTMYLPGGRISIDYDFEERYRITNNDKINKYEQTVEDSTGYGAWMRDSVFQVTRSSRNIPGLGNSQILFGFAGGDSTNSKPFSNATYNGLMVATPTTGITRGDFLEGDARLNYTYSDSTLDANFTNIRNVKTNSPHSTTSVSFNDINVDSIGTFRSGSTSGNFIQGGFYGPNHREAIGVFEKHDMVGAFGAKKQ